MDFMLADTFTDSLARLIVEEQKAVKRRFDLQLDPHRAGLSLQARMGLIRPSSGRN